MSVSQTHGAGRRGNLNRSLQAASLQGRARQQVREGGVRNEPAVEGFSRKLAKGVGRLLGAR